MYPAMNQNYPQGQDQGMQTPAALVPPQVLQHVHLVSSYRYPRLSGMSHEEAFKYLTQAPTIVKETAPVAWTYFPQPPADGTVILTYQPPQMGTTFASDGIVWADQETSWHRNHLGYTIQVVQHTSGFVYSANEQFTLHCRYRYRLINGPGAFDPSLWIVFYGAADPKNRVPASACPIPPQVAQQMQVRAQLEAAGQLVRKEFMLFDRQNWPKVEFARQTGQQPPYYNPMQPGRAYNQPPPNKKPRQSVSQARQPMQPDGVLYSLDDEENSTQDAFDFITPREISLSRFKQHHEWMEEIFSSPYAVGNIMPIDLGLGLMGELAPLTAGILDAPGGDYRKDSKVKYNVKGYNKLAPEQLKEFETRVSAFTKKEEAELEKMKAEHAKKMAALKRSRTYIKAERRLRDIGAKGVANETTDQESENPLEKVVKNLEGTLGVTFEPKKDVICVEKGGFQEEQQVPIQKAPQTADNGANGLLDTVDAENSAAGLLDQYGSHSLGGTPGGLSIPAMSQPHSQAQSAVATPSAQPSGPQQSSNMPGGQSNMTSTDDLLDLDVEMGGMAGTDDKSGTGGNESDWVMVDQTSASSTTQSAQQPSVANTTTQAPQMTAPAPGPTTQTQPGSSAAPASAPAPVNAPADPSAGTSMFDTDFSAFDNLDSAGDALADFTNVDVDADMGLDSLVDDSAFGDAFHGTERYGAGGDGEGDGAGSGV